MEPRAPIHPDQIRKTVLEAGLDPDLMPQHIAVIMDGNGRWAKSRGLPHIAGHRAGTEALRRFIEGAIQFGIPYATIYAFSTENWKRPAHEVRGLLFLLEEVIQRQLDELDANGVRLLHLGWMDRVPGHLEQAIRRAVDRTAANRQLTLAVAFNYGARAEITRAMRQIAREGTPPDEIDEACIERHLQTATIPDPDLILRTSGEMRLSNFLLWQAAYSEFYSTETLWPDFDRETLVHALASYAGRERRYGGRVEGGPDPAGRQATAAAGTHSGAAK